MENPQSLNTAAGILASKSKDQPQAHAREIEPIEEVSAGPPILTLTKDNRLRYTALGWSKRKKWLVLGGMFFVQVSQNYNAAVFMSAVPDYQRDFGVSSFQARLAQAVFLILYAFGCELWAPFSEEFGRKAVLQVSLSLVNIFQIVCASSPTWAGVFTARALGGLSSAGGSVTLGMIADMFEPDTQFQATAFTCFGSVVGSVIAPMVSGAISQYASGRKCIWVSVMLGAVTQLIHICTAETRPEKLLDHAAKKMRNDQDQQILGPWEAAGGLKARLQPREIVKMMWRPYKLLFTEPIVLFLSLLSGFSDSLIFSGLDSFAIVLSQWKFSNAAIGASFSSLFIGYIVGWLAAALHYRLNPGRPKKNNDMPEQRLWLLLFLVLFCPIGLTCFAFSSLGPNFVHWFGVLFSAFLVGIANYAIYLHTIDYLIAAYGPIAASATGGNGFCRDFLAGVAALYTKPMYEGIAPHSKYELVWPTFLLAMIGICLTIPVYYFYFRGSKLRAKSKWAVSIENARTIENQEALGSAIELQAIVAGGLRQRKDGVNVAAVETSQTEQV